MAFDAQPTLYEESERQLFRLVYASRPAALIAPRRGAAMGEMLASSLRNNPRFEVTGLLLSHDDWFLQLLEGPRAGVRATYRRIERDARHHGVVPLAADIADERLFPQWSMCARAVDDIDEATQARLGLTPAFNPLLQSTGGLMRLLEGVGEAQANRHFASVQDLRARLTVAA